jgi:hypothetical protein
VAEGVSHAALLRLNYEAHLGFQFASASEMFDDKLVGGCDHQDKIAHPASQNTLHYPLDDRLSQDWQHGFRSIQGDRM